MTTMMSKIEEFVTRNGMSESVKREMLEILNESLLEISRGIMNESKVNKVNKVKVEKGPSTDESNKRYKSKKAEEYAEEHGLTLEDFDINEISKKDVETKVREMTKNKKEITTTSKTNSNEGSKEVKREKVICSGINKKGEACKSVGTIKPEGAKKKYCFRHAEDFRSFECDSDSSDEEEECTTCETNTQKELTKNNSDDELFEEEYN
jgi:hypothetical protein